MNIKQVRKINNVVIPMVALFTIAFLAVTKQWAAIPAWVVVIGYTRLFKGMDRIADTKDEYISVLRLYIKELEGTLRNIMGVPRTININPKKDTN